MLDTPILFLIFNRPDTTKKVFAKIRQVKPKKLFIAADGSRFNVEREKEKCEASRAIINEIDWDCEIKTLFNVENKGCGKAVSDAISWFFEFVAEGIILEDDCLPSIGFFKYCEVMLDRYRNESRVLHIGGNNFQFGKKWGKGDYYFSTLTHIWGWATWKRAWSNYQLNIANSEMINDKNFEDAFSNNDVAVKYFKDIFRRVADYEIDTWDYQWQYTIIKNNGLAICPNINLVKNIGFRKDATHTVKEPEWNKEITVHNLNSFFPPVHLKIEHEADNLTLKNIFQINEYVKSDNYFEKRVESKIKKDLESFYKFTRLLRFIKNKIIRLIPSKIKYIIKLYTNKNFKVNEVRKISIQKEAEIERLRIENLPRFTETELEFLNKKIQIVDIASFNFIRKEIFDQQIYKFKAATDEPYIIDCGANIGLSIIYFKQLYPNAKIVGFEPDAKVFKALGKNIGTFNFSNVELIKKACWNEETTLKFYSEGADGGRVAMNFDTEQIIEVETIRLRKFLDRKVDFLKIDIEGAEVEVLNDITDLLINVEKIFVEFHSFVGKEQMLPEILTILKNAGFRVTVHHIGIYSPNPFISVLNYSNMDLQLNIYGYRS